MVAQANFLRLPGLVRVRDWRTRTCRISQLKIRQWWTTFPNCVLLFPSSKEWDRLGPKRKPRRTYILRQLATSKTCHAGFEAPLHVHTRWVLPPPCGLEYMPLGGFHWGSACWISALWNPPVFLLQIASSSHPDQVPPRTATTYQDWVSVRYSTRHNITPPGVSSGYHISITQILHEKWTPPEAIQTKLSQWLLWAWNRSNIARCYWENCTYIKFHNFLQRKYVETLELKIASKNKKGPFNLTVSHIFKLLCPELE